MLSKCANPVCSNAYGRLSEGKLFAVDARQWGRVEYFWLCDTCSRSLALVFKPTKDVVIRATRAEIAGRPSALIAAREIENVNRLIDR